GAVAEDASVAVGAGGEIPAGAADQDAACRRAGTDPGDLVIAADVGARGVHVAREIGVAGVAEDDVAAEAHLDLVALRAAEDHIAAAGAADLVDAADRVVDGLHPKGHSILAVHLAAVADDHVVALGAGDEVVACAADQDAAGAAASAFAGDLVTAADIRISGGDVAADDGGALVAEDDVAAKARRDLVARGTAEHDVAAAATADVVDAASLLVALPLPEGHAILAVHLAAVADDHVVAVGAGDQVVAR